MKTILASTSLAAAFALTALTAAPAAAEMPEVTDQLLQLGEKTYVHECASCHGDTGAGDGPGAKYLNPKPRNFELGVYIIRSTASGEVPTPNDLFKTITNGIAAGSMMPSFASLTEEERWAVVAHIQRLGGIEEEEPEVIQVGAEPAKTAASITAGASVYQRLKCAACHGDDARGMGSSSLSLKNDAKERLYPLDLTRGVYKGGSEGSDLYMRIASGLDGTPMPSYAAEATPQEIWELVHYMQSLTAAAQ